MKKTKKRAFILSECNSPYIQQAIFILKDGYDSESSKVVADAERIVASYMGTPFSADSKKSFKSTLVSLIVSAIGITVIGILFFLLK